MNYPTVRGFLEDACDNAIMAHVKEKCCEK